MDYLDVAILRHIRSDVGLVFWRFDAYVSSAPVLHVVARSHSLRQFSVGVVIVVHWLPLVLKRRIIHIGRWHLLGALLVHKQAKKFVLLVLLHYLCLLLVGELPP